MPVPVTRIKKARTETVFTMQKAETLLKRIGDKQATINRITDETEEKIKVIKARATKQISALTKSRNKLFDSLYAYALPRKKHLTSTYRTIRTLVGTFGWRFTPPFVKTKEGKTDTEIISLLKDLGLTKYIRTVETIDREALLRDKAIVPCIIYEQSDEFFAKPKLPQEAGKSKTLAKTEVI